MKDQQYIVNYDGQPFELFDNACWLRDLLIKQTSQHYQVIADAASNGYLIEVPQVDFKVVGEGATHTENTTIVTTVYRQALRSWVLFVPVIIVGLLIILFPVIFWEVLFKLLQIHTLPQWVELSVLFSATETIGILIILCGMVRFFWTYYSDALTITQDGVERTKGIVARQSISLRYSDIRSIGIKQNLFQRILGIGALEFSAAGTDGYEISFDNILNPETIKKMIQYTI